MWDVKCLIIFCVKSFLLILGRVWSKRKSNRKLIIDYREINETNCCYYWHKIYIYQNNIYYKSSVEDNAFAIIKTGQPGIVYNGIPDWLYGERIWKTNRAFWWNPSGDRLCFASFDDSFVDTISFIKYGSYESTSDLMPEIVSLKYPKPGATNPSVSLWMSDLSIVSTPKRLEHKELKGFSYFL